jgi:hypothetical protein
MRPRFLASLALLVLTLAPAAAHAGLPYHDGDKVIVTGIVTDAQGHALPGTTVVLEGSRNSFSVHSFSREKHDAQQARARTDAHGEYSISWEWAAYYNHFELLVGEPYKRAGGAAGFLVVDQQDLTPRLRGGSPVVAAVTVKDTAPLETLRAFVAGLKATDQRAVYDTMGRPEQVDRLVLPGGVEETWWYFAAGKSYRFRDGRQVDVTPFDPVVRF